MLDPEKEARRQQFLKLLEKHSAADLSRLLGASDNYLNRVKSGNKAIGEQLARKWEALLQKPRYWFDGATSQASDAEERKSLYHGVLLTRAGALFAAEWEKLDLSDRMEIEHDVLARVGRKVRSKRKPTQQTKASSDD